jgi:hypothetical protein
MRAVRVNVTTDASGDGTGYGDAVVGLLYAVQLVDGTFDDNVDLTLTAEREDLSIPLLVKADWNTDQMALPRVAESLNTDGSALTNYAMQVVFGRPKAVIAQGGNAKTGAVILYVLEV